MNNPTHVINDKGHSDPLPNPGIETGIEVPSPKVYDTYHFFDDSPRALAWLDFKQDLVLLLQDVAWKMDAYHACLELMNGLLTNDTAVATGGPRPETTPSAPRPLTPIHYRVPTPFPRPAPMGPAPLLPAPPKSPQ